MGAAGGAAPVPAAITDVPLESKAVTQDLLGAEQTASTSLIDTSTDSSASLSSSPVPGAQLSLPALPRWAPLPGCSLICKCSTMRGDEGCWDAAIWCIASFQVAEENAGMGVQDHGRLHDSNALVFVLMPRSAAVLALQVRAETTRGRRR
jgi:hypothetical protein